MDPAAIWKHAMEQVLGLNSCFLDDTIVVDPSKDQHLLLAARLGTVKTE